MQLKNIFLLVFSVTLCLFLIGGMSSAQPDKVFLVKFTVFRDYSVMNVTADVVEGDTFIPGGGRGEYQIQLTDEGRNILYRFNSSIYFREFTLVGDDVVLNKTLFRARLPFDNQVKYFKFLKDGRIIFELDLIEKICVPNDNACIEYCSYNNADPDCKIKTTTTTNERSIYNRTESKCGNDVCEAGEDKENCPEDCESGFPYYILWVLIAIVVVSISIMIVLQSRGNGEYHD
ncbi:MAG: hypothetical protein ABEK17_04590 [Candidatus Aenigmatarchaeota archaeon]